VFLVHSANPSEAPRTYTVEPHKQLSGTWGATAGYSLAVHGPNGLFRSFADDSATGANLAVKTSYQGLGDIMLLVTNRSNRRTAFQILEAYSNDTVEQKLGPGERFVHAWSLRHSAGWYEFVVTTHDDPGFEHRLAGHVEDGSDSTSDPAMGGVARLH